jgi:DNA primase
MIMRWCDICQQPWSFAYCGHHRTPHQAQPTPPASARVSCAVPATLDHVYQGLLTALPLSSAHRQALRQRGLADSEIRRRQYDTLPLKGRAALAERFVNWWGADVCAQVPGFYVAERNGQRWWTLAGAAGLLIPVRDLEGHIVALKVRADAPGNGSKYTTVSSAKHGGPSPGAQMHVPLHEGPTGDTVRLTEGELKADVATALSGLFTVSIPGVAMWRKALPVLQALGIQRVLLAFDADWRTNSHVAHALGHTAYALVKAGFEVQVEVWEPALGKGIDDLLAAGHTPAVQSVTLAFGAGFRGQARVWTGSLPTIAAEEVPSWRSSP